MKQSRCATWRNGRSGSTRRKRGAGQKRNRRQRGGRSKKPSTRAKPAAAPRRYFADSTYTEFGTQRSVSGFDAMLGLMQGWKATMPDVRGTVTGAAEEGQRVALEIVWEGTQTGELVTEQGTIPASGNRQRTPAAWVFDYEGGQPRESRHYFDMLSFLQQIGAA
jgi:predicted ester cyclase